MHTNAITWDMNRTFNEGKKVVLIVNALKIK